jgi:hypothetical protein
MRAALATGVTEPEKASAWLVVKVTPRASRVAAFVALWGAAMVDLDTEDLGIEAYARWASESRRTAYRRLADFRVLWPEYETPNELGRLVAAQVRERGKRPDPASLVIAA